jgi:hypothetical protein
MRMVVVWVVTPCTVLGGLPAFWRNATPPFSTLNVNVYLIEIQILCHIPIVLYVFVRINGSVYELCVK